MTNPNAEAAGKLIPEIDTPTIRIRTPGIVSRGMRAGKGESSVVRSQQGKILRVREALKQLQGQMQHCRLCPRDCAVNRSNGSVGFCQVSDWVKLYKFKLHSGEEPPISATSGSGILFFTGCTLDCAFCQNFPMSHYRQGYPISPSRLAQIMLTLQQWGAHNINLVTPSHFLPPILEGMLIALDQGLTLPIVYNSNGYEKVEILRLLDGIVDIYLPDMKYASEEMARRYSHGKRYVEATRVAVKEMFRQVGFLRVDVDGVAMRGLIVRHLLLPNDRSGTEEVLQFLAQNLGNEIHISLMTQYLPIWNAHKHPEIDRRITPRESEEAITLLEKYGFHNGWIQNLD